MPAGASVVVADGASAGAGRAQPRWKRVKKVCQSRSTLPGSACHLAYRSSRCWRLVTEAKEMGAAMCGTWSTGEGSWFGERGGDLCDGLCEARGAAERGSGF